MRVWLSAIALGALAGVSACAPPATVAPEGAAPTRSVLAAPITIPVFDADTHRHPGCYSAGAAQVKFRITTIDSDDAQDWKAEAEALSTDCDFSAPWDGKWYYRALPGDQPRNLLIHWKDVKTGEYDYLAIKYVPPHFELASKAGALGKLVDGQRKVYPFKLSGQKIHIDVHDMPDDAVWKPNEIKWRINH